MQSDLVIAARELQELQQWEAEQNSVGTPSTKHRRFPTSCLRLLRGIEGNLRCIDCDATNPQWATVSFGALLCIDCSGSHRQLGVQISIVRSLSMDSWSHSEILSMLEGGNKQLNDFFVRHNLPSSHYIDNDENDAYACTFSSSNAITRNRYKTNAAMFYRENLAQHVLRIKEEGIYHGRENFRRVKKTSPRKGKKRKNGGSGNGSPGTCAVECGLGGGKGAENNTVGV